MGIDEFVKKVRSAVEKELGREYVIELKEIRKNNGVLLHGMMIMSKGQNVAPTIYLDSFWEAYEAGTSFASVIRRLMAVYRDDAPKSSIDVDFFRSFDAVKDRICYRLIGRKGNGELLKDVPNIEFLDLAICFYYAYSSRELGEGIIMIHDSHMRMWDTCISELLRLAQCNTPRLFPCECSTIEDVLSELTGQKPGGRDALSGKSAGSRIPMRVLSNSKRVHGAASILYPGVLERIAEAEENSIYIIPSSIHEVILLTDEGVSSAESLRNMIAEVNSTQVAPEEVLSDSLYRYDFKGKGIEIV